MAIELSWANEEQTGLVVHCRGMWTGEELIAIRPEADKLINSVPHQVDLVINLLDAENRLPQGGISMFGELLRERNPKTDRIIVVGVHPVVKMFSNLFLRVYPQIKAHYSLVNTLDAALKIIATREQQPT